MVQIAVAGGVQNFEDALQRSHAVRAAALGELRADVLQHLAVFLFRQRVRVEVEHAILELPQVDLPVQVVVVAVEQRAPRALPHVVALDLHEHLLELVERQRARSVQVELPEYLRQLVRLPVDVREVGEDLEPLADQLLEVVRGVVLRRHGGDDGRHVRRPGHDRRARIRMNRSDCRKIPNMAHHVPPWECAPLKTPVSDAFRERDKNAGERSKPLEDLAHWATAGRAPHPPRSRVMSGQMSREERRRAKELEEARKVRPRRARTPTARASSARSSLAPLSSLPSRRACPRRRARSREPSNLD